MGDKTTAKIDTFFRKFNQRSYKKGEILIRADDSPVGIFYIVEGSVKEYAISKKGDELVVNQFKPLSFFPMSWAINNKPNRYFFEASTDTEVFKAPKDSVLEFLMKNPDALYDLVSRIYKGVDGVLTRMTYLMAGNAHARLVTELIIQAKRFGKKTDKGIEIEISEKDLAAQSGMTRETISREMKTLKESGRVIISKNKLTLKDLQKFENELIDGV